MKSNLKAYVLALTFQTFTSWAWAEVELPSIFSDHMVLQRERENLIWGFATPRETIEVSIAGQRRSTQADSEGNWKLLLPALPAGGPFQLEVTGQSSLILHDILVGEVWLASGQSNMQFAVGGTTGAVRELSDSERPQLRLFQVPKTSRLSPADDVRTAWQTCGPATAGGFSAVAYHFGRRLQEQLGVPVGMIEASWGGTNAEEWASHEFLNREPDFLPIFKRWEAVAPSVTDLFDAGSTAAFEIDDIRLESESGSTLPLLIDDFEDGDLINLLFAAWRANLSGLEISPDPDGAGPGSRSLKASENFHPGVTTSLETRFSPGPYIDARDYERITFRCRGNGYLKLHSLQPDVTDWDNYTASAVALEAGWKSVTVLFSSLRQAGWGKARPFTAHRLTGVLFEWLPVEGLSRPPSGLYNGMIHPLTPFGLAGVIWYQGEGNAGRAFQYRKLLPALMASWRSAFDSPRLPFLVVQLPNYHERQKEPRNSAWAELREAQLLTVQADPNAGLAVTIDLGEDDDVHPREKAQVGSRLAALALGQIYRQGGVFSGPLYRDMIQSRGRYGARVQACHSLDAAHRG